MYRRDKLRAQAINLIVVGWPSSGLPAWESIVFIYHTPRSKGRKTEERQSSKEMRGIDRNWWIREQEL